MSKPTIAELEAILNEPDGLRIVALNPDGSIGTELTELGKYVEGLKADLAKCREEGKRSAELLLKMKATLETSSGQTETAIYALEKAEKIIHQLEAELENQAANHRVGLSVSGSRIRTLEAALRKISKGTEPINGIELPLTAEVLTEMASTALGDKNG